MQDDSLEGRMALLEEMRETVRQNEQDIRGCSHTYGCKTGYLNAEEKPVDEVPAASTFSLRLLLSLIILGGFLWMHMEGMPIFGYSSEKVVEAISQDVNLRDLTNSVKINNQER